MRMTRSGLVYGGDYDPWRGLQQEFGSDAPLSNQQIISIIEPAFRQMAQDPNFNTNTGNIAALVAKFAGRELLVEYSYSTNSSLNFETQYQYNLAPQTTDFQGEFSEQSNNQARNHTEPKLLQEFSDQYLAVGLGAHLKWLVIVTDRACCGTCLAGSIQQASRWCANNNVAFWVLDLQHTIAQSTWTPVRTNWHIPG
jgi:hypothetical protein